MAFLAKWQAQLLSILRIMSGLLFFQHGSAKLLHFPHVPTFDGKLPAMIIAAGVVELVGGALVTIGLFTRYAAFIMSGEMAVAYFLVHSPQNFFPVLNNGEDAILFCFVFLYLAAAGPGLWAIDRK